MSGGRRRGCWRGAVPDHDVAGLQLGLAERLAELRCASAQLHGSRGPLRPHPHRCPLAAERYQRMDRTGRLDVEREPGPPNTLCRFDLGAATAIARSLTVVTRNVRDFKTFPVSVVDPFAAA